MRNFYLIVNREKPRVEEAADLICSFFAEQGCRCIRLDRHDGLRRDAGVIPAYRYTDRRTVPEDTDCVICLGGDGTLIQAARDLAGRKIPLFGINMGHLGYLTQIGHEEDILPAMRDLMEDHYRLESRMMLRGCVISGGKVVMEDIALNDIVLNRMGIDAFRFELAVNGQLFNEYSADGMVVATPTGSTAYNLSAGGPIVAPEADLMVLTPLCPHSLNSRSIVLPPDNHLSLRIQTTGRTKVSLSFDGDTVVDIEPGDTIEIAKSEIETTLIQLKQVPDFFPLPEHRSNHHKPRPHPASFPAFHASHGIPPVHPPVPARFPPGLLPRNFASLAARSAWRPRDQRHGPAAPPADGVFLPFSPHVSHGGGSYLLSHTHTPFRCPV